MTESVRKGNYREIQLMGRNEMVLNKSNKSDVSCEVIDSEEVAFL